MTFTHVLLIVIGVLLVGIVGLFSVLSIKQKQFESRLQSEKESIKEQYAEYNKKAENILNENKSKKESLHTGDVKQDFENSLKILNGIKK